MNSKKIFHFINIFCEYNNSKLNHKNIYTIILDYCFFKCENKKYCENYFLKNIKNYLICYSCSLKHHLTISNTIKWYCKDCLYKLKNVKDTCYDCFKEKYFCSICDLRIYFDKKIAYKFNYCRHCHYCNNTYCNKCFKVAKLGINDEICKNCVKKCIECKWYYPNSYFIYNNNNNDKCNICF